MNFIWLIKWNSVVIYFFSLLLVLCFHGFASLRLFFVSSFDVMYGLSSQFNHNYARETFCAYVLMMNHAIKIPNINNKFVCQSVVDDNSISFRWWLEMFKWTVNAYRAIISRKSKAKKEKKKKSWPNCQWNLLFVCYIIVRSKIPFVWCD